MNYVSEVADDEKWGGKIEDSRMSEIGKNEKQRKRVAVGENMKWRYERAPKVDEYKRGGKRQTRNWVLKLISLN